MIIKYIYTILTLSLVAIQWILYCILKDEFLKSKLLFGPSEWMTYIISLFFGVILVEIISRKEKEHSVTLELLIKECLDTREKTIKIGSDLKEYINKDIQHYKIIQLLTDIKSKIRLIKVLSNRFTGCKKDVEHISKYFDDIYKLITGDNFATRKYDNETTTKIEKSISKIDQLLNNCICSAINSKN